MNDPRTAASRRIAIIVGHPDPSDDRYGRALARAYEAGAVAAGHDAKVIDIARLDIPYLRSSQEWMTQPTSDDLLAAQATIAWADHLVLIFPLWLGDMPALLKSFLEQVSRDGFVMSLGADRRWRRNLQGKSARVIVTMGMPAVVYRFFFLAHSLKSLERNILKFAGADPVLSSVIGSMEAPRAAAARRRWLETARKLGESCT